MKIIKINPAEPEKEKIELALNVLKHGGTVVYPTDTTYGLGVNIYDEKAIEMVFILKKRSFDKPLSICVSKISDINKIAYLNDFQEEIIRKILPGPYTVVLKRKEYISSLLTAGGDRIGIRIPDNKICREITRLFPITTTSANLSGGKSPESVNEVIEQFGDSVDLILDVGKSLNKSPSTVVDLTADPPEILRKGDSSVVSGLQTFLKEITRSLEETKRG